MSTRTKPKGEIVTVVERRSLTVVQHKPGQRWRLLDHLADNADTLVERSGELSQLQITLWRKQALVRKSSPTLISTIDPDGAELNDDDRDLIADCREALALLTPPDCYDDEGQLTKDAIAKRLAAMAAAIPAGGAADADAYAHAMIEHVGAVDGLTYIALDDACRRRAEGKPFHPNPGELVTLLREQQEIWSRRTSAIEQIERQSQELIAEIAEFMPQLEAAVAASDQREAEFELNRARYRREQAAKHAVQMQANAAEAAKRAHAAMDQLAKDDAWLAEKAQALADATAAAERAMAAVANERPSHRSKVQSA